MTWPTVRAQVAFDTAPLAASPTWTTVHEGTTTQRAMSATVRTGRAFELDPFQPGRMTLKLDNSDRRFDPLHAAGPYYGKLLPRKRTRLQADWGTYLNLTGASGSNASTPHHASLGITGDIDLRLRITPAYWATPGAAGELVARWGANISYLWRLDGTTGKLQLYWSPDGTTLLSSTSTAATGFTDGTAHWLRVTLDVNNGAAGNTVAFYTSNDDTNDHTAVAWTALGSPVVTAGTTSIFANNTPVVIGELFGATIGKVHAFALLDGIGGTVVASPDFSDGNRFTAGTLTGTDATSRVWTVSAPASLDAVTYDLFSGFVDTWPQDARRFMGVSEMTATDGFKVLSRIDIGGAYEETVRGDAPAGWWRLGDNTPTSNLCADSSGYGHDGYFKGLPASVDSIVDGADDSAVDFDGGNDRVILDPAAALTTAPLTVEAWIVTTQNPTVRSLIFAQTYTVNGFNFSLMLALDNGGAAHFTFNSAGTLSGALSAALVNDDLIHHVVGSVDTDKKARIYIDGVLADTGSAASNLDVLGGASLYVGQGDPGLSGWSRFDGVIDEVAVYDTALTADQVLAHYRAGHAPWTGDTTGVRIGRILTLAGWPAADRDIDTGKSAMGPYLDAESNALSIAQRAEATEGGALWQAPDGRITFRDRHAPIQDYNATVSQATFTDDGTATNPNHYSALDLTYDDTLIVNEASVSWVDGVETSRDNTSIAAYTRSAVRVETGLTTAPEARDRGDWLLARYKNPAVRPDRVVLRPSADQRLWRHCLARRIGDRVTVRRRPQDTGTAISFDATIESINHRISDGKNTWETEFGLSPTAVDLGWLILDDTAKGLLDTGRVAF